MIVISSVEVSNMENALRGMRNPMDSWEKNDSFEELVGVNQIFDEEDCDPCAMKYFRQGRVVNAYKKITIGEKDMRLAQSLIKAGSEHSKFMRQIFVSMDIDCPLYWWKEMDQYRVGATTNSCSTMHKIHSKEIQSSLFSFDNVYELDNYQYEVTNRFLGVLEGLRKEVVGGNREAWRLLIQLLPSGWNQKRTWTGNYSILRNICQQRASHKLSEWHEFIEVVSKLPYAKELILL